MWPGAVPHAMVPRGEAPCRRTSEAEDAFSDFAAGRASDVFCDRIPGRRAAVAAPVRGRASPRRAADPAAARLPAADVGQGDGGREGPAARRARRLIAAPGGVAA